MKRSLVLFLFFSLFLLPISGVAQGAHRVSQVIVKGNGIAANISPSAKVLVCVLNTGCKTAANIYLDSALTTPAPNPLTADGSGNYDYYLSSGCVDEQISAPGQGAIFVPNVCPFNGQSGGGGLNPGLQTQIVQYPTTGSTGGPSQLTTDTATGKNLTVPRIFTGQITNGGLNSDTYATGGGNNGVANAIASSDCTGGCLIGRPQTSTDTEAISFALNNAGDYFHALDSKYGTDSGFFVNSGQNLSGVHERDASPTTCFWKDALAEPNNNLNCRPIYATYNSPGRYGQGSTAVSKARNTTFTMYESGIGQMYGGIFNALSVGDKALQYLYMNYRGGGTQGADERDEGIYTAMQEADNPYGNVSTGGTGATTIQLKTVANSGNLAAGHNLLDIQSPETSGLIVSQTVGSGNLPNNATTSDTHAVNTGYGVTTASCGTYVARNSPVSSTCSLTGVVGTLVAGPACVGDYRNPEQIQITAATGSSITAGFTYVHPAGVPIEQGGLCGDYVVMGNGSSTIAAPYYLTSYSIVGSPTATSFDYVIEDNGGQSGKVQIPITVYPAETILGTITRASNVVTIGNPAPNTAFEYNGYVAPSGAAITISGATPSDLNGTVTGTVVTPSMMTWNQTGADETGSGGTISVTGLNNYFAYCGAETVFMTVQLNTASQPVPNNNVQVEPNHCSWAANDEVAQPNHYAIGAIAHRTILNGFSPGLSGNNFVPNLTQISGQSYSGAYLYNIQDFDTINSYQGYGGSLKPHGGWTSTDVYSTLFNQIYAPANGGRLFNLGCDPAGCSANSYDYSLFQLQGASGVGNGQVNYSPSHNYFYTTGLGLYANSSIGANAAIGLSGKPGQGFTVPGTAAPGVAYFTAVGSSNTTVVLGTGTLGDSSGTLGAKTLAAPNVIAGAPAPGNFTVTPTGTTGSTTYAYACTAVTANGESTAGTGTTTSGNATLSSSNYNSILCQGVPGAQSLNVYRTSGGATQGRIANIPNGNTNNPSIVAFKDTGLAGDGTSPPGINDTGSLTDFGLRQGLPATVNSAGKVISITTGFTGTCAPTTTLTVVNGLITGCS